MQLTQTPGLDEAFFFAYLPTLVGYLYPLTRRREKHDQNTVLLLCVCVFTNITSGSEILSCTIGILGFGKHRWCGNVPYTIEATDESSTEQVPLLEITTEYWHKHCRTTHFLFSRGGRYETPQKSLRTLGVFGVAYGIFTTGRIFSRRAFTSWGVEQRRNKTNILKPPRGPPRGMRLSRVEDSSPGGRLKLFKVRVRTRSTAALGVSRSTSYQWLAPDHGPVKFETDQDIVFELVSSNLIATKIPYDVNADGTVNILDLVFVASHFGQTNPKADVNADGTVNILDLTLIAQNFGN